MIGLTSLLAVVIAGPVYDPGPIRPEDGDTPAEIEVSRIQRHLSHVEQTLRADPPAWLDDEQRAARQRALDILHDYWQAGQFPKNRDYPDRRLPYFIDADGVACAVGHLMIHTDGEQLAREIATYENHDFVAQIDNPGVPGWLERNGFEAWEAAWIQPGYSPCGFELGPLVCGADGNTYLCEAIALNCAGVEVAHEGACGTETGTGTGSGTEGSTETGIDPGEVIGEEICVGIETGTSSGGDSTAEGGNSTQGAESGETSASSTGTPNEDTGQPSTNDDDESGCACTSGGSGGASGALALLALGLLGRRRRSR